MTSKEKIEEIIFERDDIVNKIFNRIKEDGEVLNSNIGNIITTLNFADTNDKHYIAVVKAQELIENLVDEISQCRNLEDLIELRKKLNKYINVIKKELKLRGVSDEILNNYLDKVTFVRKGIAKLVRTYKRNEGLIELDETDEEDLDEDGLKNYKKRINQEKSYNKRTLKTLEPSYEMNLLEKRKEKLLSKEVKEMIDKNNRAIQKEREQRLANDDEVIRQMITHYLCSWNINETAELKGSFGKKLALFLREYRLYRANIRKAQNAKSQYRIDDTSDTCGDIKEIIAFIMQESNIKNKLHAIIQKTSLPTSEQASLDYHNRCYSYVLNELDKKGIKNEIAEQHRTLNYTCLH